MVIESIILGLSLYTTHLEHASRFNHETVGAYVILDHGLTAGSLKNCLSKRSNYLAYSFDTPMSTQLTIGSITGYSSHIKPLLTVSKEWHGMRITLIPPPQPKASAAIHFSYEWEIK
jgi:hypothetical protein